MLKAIPFFGRYHSHLLCQHIQAAYALRMQLFYIVHTVMEWVACKSPMPLQAQVLYMFSCICNGILPGFNAETALCLKYWLITRVGKIQGHVHFSLASEKAFPAYSMAICCVLANITAYIFES